ESGLVFSGVSPCACTLSITFGVSACEENANQRHANRKNFTTGPPEKEWVPMLPSLPSYGGTILRNEARQCLEPPWGDALSIPTRNTGLGYSPAGRARRGFPGWETRHLRSDLAPNPADAGAGLSRVHVG